jgi:hypothetical protein
MSVGHRPPNLRAGDAREQVTRILEPLAPEVLHGTLDVLVLIGAFAGTIAYI